MNSMDLLYSGYLISIVILVIAVILSGFFVLPAQLKEARIKDALYPLRVEFLIYRMIIVITGLLAILVLTARFYITDIDQARLVIGALILMFSLGYLAMGIIGVRMYRHKFDAREVLGFKPRRVKK